MKLIIGLSLLWSLQLFAVDNPLQELLAEVPHEQNLTTKQLQFIQAELRLQSIIIEGVEKIRLDGGDFANIQRAGSTTRDIILQSSLSRYVFNSEVQKTKFSEAIKKVFTPQYMRKNLGEISKLGKRFISWQSQLLTSTARNQGVLYALVKFISIQLDTTIPAILIGTGNVVGGAALLSAPVSPVALFPFKVLKDTIKNISLVKRLGLKESIHQFKLNRSVKQLYSKGIIEQMKLINAHFDGQQYIVSYQTENILTRLVGRRNYKASLNLTSLTRFLSDFPQYDELLRNVSQSRAPQELKLFTLLASVENHSSSEIANSFRERFKDSLFQTDNIDIPRNHRSWILKVSHAKDFNTFYHHLRKIPQDIHPQILERVWRQYIVPNLADSIEGQYSLKAYKAFQNLNKVFEADIRPQLINTNAYFGQEIRNQFINKIFKALGPVENCSFIFSPLRGGL